MEVYHVNYLFHILICQQSLIVDSLSPSIRNFEEEHIAVVWKGHTHWLDHLLNYVDKRSKLLHQAAQAAIMDKACNI